MPEFTREELVNIYNLLGEFKDSLRNESDYEPSLYSNKDDLRKDIVTTQDKIFKILYP